MLLEENIVEQLSRNGYRITQPRRAVIRALLESDGYQSPAEVHRCAKAYSSSVGLVTVYRTLDLLAQMGYARRIHTEDGCHGYVIASRGHHRHHLVCRCCGAAVEFDGCDLSGFLEQVKTETGYQIEEHLLELVGICPDCQNA